MTFLCLCFQFLQVPVASLKQTFLPVNLNLNSLKKLQIAPASVVVAIERGWGLTSGQNLWGLAGLPLDIPGGPTTTADILSRLEATGTC